MIPFLARLLGTSKKRTILFAWELGAGLGHIRRLIPIATQLAVRDCRIVFALRRPDDADVIRERLPTVKVLRAPVYGGQQHDRNGTAAFNYADMLHRCGYNTMENLGPVVSRWRELLDVEKPALVVCDHSPTVILATAGRVPVVNIGSGFAIPPPKRPFMPLFPASATGAREREDDVLRAINEVHEQLATPRLDRVCDFFSFSENFACCLPEVDPYQAVRKEPALGPVEKIPKPVPLSTKEFIFGYLYGGYPSTQRIIENLVQANVPCGLYVLHCPPAWEQLVRGSAVRLYPAPQKMPETLINASAFVHHGGSMAETALALGRPQFLFPRTLDQLLMAGAVEKLHCGVNLSTHGNPGEAIRRALSRGTYRKEAAAVAGRIATRPAPNVTSLIVAACAKQLS